MASCEKCWSDSAVAREVYGDSEAYRRLVSERQCSPEDQAGPDATMCPRCNRRTVHQHAHVCMVGFCGYEGRGDQADARMEVTP